MERKRFLNKKGRNNVRYIDALRTDAAVSGMFEHVKKLLAPVDALSKSGRVLTFRSRFAHIERVTEWALRIAERENCDRGVVAVAAIFHDSGYCYAGEGHAALSAQIFREYAVRCPGGAVSDSSNAVSALAPDSVPAASPAVSANVPNDAVTAILSDVASTMASSRSVELISSVIAAHSSKDICNEDLPQETKILMDADLLDEAGAIAVLWDCFVEAAEPDYNYASAYLRMLARFEGGKRDSKRFHTAEGKKLNANMRRYVRAFLNGLKTELNC